jgi:hypothetical protein
VLVPGLGLPLHIFEQRYRLLVTRLLALPPAEREFGVIGLRAGPESLAGVDAQRDEAQPRLYSVGTTALLTDAEEVADGRFNIETVGSRRFRILDVDESEPYLQARVEFLDEPLVIRDGGEALDADIADLSAMSRIVRRRFMGYRVSLTDEDLESPLPDDPTALSYFVVAAMIHERHVCQRLLEVPDTRSRLVAEAALLRDEQALIQELGLLPDTALVDDAVWSAN